MDLSQKVYARYKIPCFVFINVLILRVPGLSANVAVAHEKYLNHKNVSVSLRSAQNRCPPDIVRPVTKSPKMPRFTAPRLTSRSRHSQNPRLCKHIGHFAHCFAHFADYSCFLVFSSGFMLPHSSRQIRIYLTL